MRSWTDKVAIQPMGAMNPVEDLVGRVMNQPLSAMSFRKPAIEAAPAPAQSVSLDNLAPLKVDSSAPDLGGQEKPKSINDVFRDMTPKQYVGFTAATTALAFAGSIMQDRENEKNAEEQIKAQLAISETQITRDSTLQNIVRTSAATRALIQRISMINQQAQGQQHQVFIKDPTTGVTLNA
jgi:hypothetical protein